MTQIIAVAGEKQSGKNTTCNFITMLKIIEYGVARKARINDEGEIEVSDIFGESIAGMEWFPLNHPMVQTDLLFNDNASICKMYAFADDLKKFLIDVVGLSYESMNGTDEEKNAKTKFKWQNMPGVIGSREAYKNAAPEIKRNSIFRRDGFMTGRDLMQWFGTEICRSIRDDIWLNSTLTKIAKDKPEIALICDCRFDNEIRAIQEAGGFVVGLTRKIENKEAHKKHKSEQVKLNLCDVVVDNTDSTIAETNEMIYNHIKELPGIPNVFGDKDNG